MEKIPELHTLQTDASKPIFFVLLMAMLMQEHYGQPRGIIFTLFFGTVIASPSTSYKA